MRFREFHHLFEFAPPKGDHVSLLLSILNNPESSQGLKQRITDLFSKILQGPKGMAKQGQPMGQEPVANTMSPTPQEQEPISEGSDGSLTQEQLDKIRQEISQNPAYKAAIDAIEAQATREGVNLGVGLASNPDAVMANSSDQIESLVANLKQIPDDVKTVITDACITVWRKTKKIQPILDFLNACSQPQRPIDMPGIIDGNSSGKLVTAGDPYFEIIRYLAKLNPGTGNSASGQGEWMLVLAGTNATKIHPGDIAVGETRVEVKASDTKEGKTSLTDFVLNSKKMNVKEARDILVNAINSTLGRKAVSSGRSSEGGISALNDKTLTKLNPLFVEMNQKIPNKVQDTFQQMWKSIMPEEELQEYIDGIVSAIDEDGTVTLENLYGPTAILAAAYYKLTNSHDVLLLLNIPTLSYKAVSDPTEIASLINAESTQLTMSSIFDFRENPGAPTFKLVVAKEIKKQSRAQ